MRACDLDALTAYIQSDDCTKDLQALLAGTFDYPLPRQVQLRKSHSERRRTVFVYPERQNNLMKYLTWGMLEYDGVFSESLFSFRKSKGVSDVFRNIVRAGYVRNLYVAKADVHDYGYSIKPTLLKLIADLYQPTSGEIRYGNKSRDEIPDVVFKSSVAIVDQEIVMFEDTISEDLK